MRVISRRRDVTSKECGRVPRQVLWRDGIGCSGREALRCQVRHESEVTTDIYALHKRGRLCREVPCAQTRFGLLAYAYYLP